MANQQGQTSYEVLAHRNLRTYNGKFVYEGILKAVYAPHSLQRHAPKGYKAVVLQIYASHVHGADGSTAPLVEQDSYHRGELGLWLQHVMFIAEGDLSFDTVVPTKVARGYLHWGRDEKHRHRFCMQQDQKIFLYGKDKLKVRQRIAGNGQIVTLRRQLKGGGLKGRIWYTPLCAYLVSADYLGRAYIAMSMSEAVASSRGFAEVVEQVGVSGSKPVSRVTRR